MDQALKEISRCVNELGLKLLCLPTHFLNIKGEWLSVAEADVDPIFELAYKYRIAIQIHPYDGEKMKPGDLVKYKVPDFAKRQAGAGDNRPVGIIIDIKNTFSGIKIKFLERNPNLLFPISAKKQSRRLRLLSMIPLWWISEMVEWLKTIWWNVGKRENDRCENGILVSSIKHDDDGNCDDCIHY